jgi:quinol-cytochrome oxidoreductase complex cytochrome b subunit
MGFWCRCRNLLADNRVVRSIVAESAPMPGGAQRRIRYRNFFLLLHPRRVRRDSLSPSATFGLGVACLTLFLLLVATGILLMFYYSPSTDPVGGAYASMEELRHGIAFGQFIRNMHRWAAHLLVVAAFLHLARVFLRGAFKPPRQFNWVIGVLLLVVTLASSFTGYLLPWDQLSYWAIEVGGGMMAAIPAVGTALRRMVFGGNEISQTTLIRYYGLHVLVLPAAFAVLTCIHLWRVRQNGGLAHRMENDDAPAQKPPATVPAWPHLVLRELAVALLCVAVVAAMAVTWDAPLGEPADPAHAPEPAKAAWYFLWLQEIVSYDYGALTRVRWPPWDPAGTTLGAEFWGGVVLPAAFLVALLAVPYVRQRRRGVGVYFGPSRRSACVVFVLVSLAILALTLVGYFLRGPNWSIVWPW